MKQCPYCKGEVVKIVRETAATEKLKHLGPGETYQCTVSQCGAKFFEPTVTPVTEATVFGDLTEFKIQNPAVEPNLEVYEGGKKLLDQVSGLVKRSSRKLLYETPHERYRNICSLIDQLRFLKALPPKNLNEALDKLIKHVKDTSPFHQ
jgi:hypothetical protein